MRRLEIKMLEKLWDEHFSEECATVDTEEERELLLRAGNFHKALNESLSPEQRERVEKYIEATYEVQGAFLKKAFVKGCEFATAFLLEAQGNKK